MLLVLSTDNDGFLLYTHTHIHTCRHTQRKKGETGAEISILSTMRNDQRQPQQQQQEQQTVGTHTQQRVTRKAGRVKAGRLEGRAT